MLTTVLHYAIPTMWLAWLLCWIVAARDVKPTRWHEPATSRAYVRIAGLLAALLLILPERLPATLNRHFIPTTVPIVWAGTILVAGGLAFAVWARLHLGRNWSATVTVKEDHTLIRTGPYRYVRHPIYTGLLLAFAGTALAIGEWRGILAFAIVLFAYMRKAQIEEERMSATFPEYEEYRHTTSALIPFVY
jgi:protein-S-isoprenylcysteine O-methyltransferase Ste14